VLHSLGFVEDFVKAVRDLTDRVDGAKPEPSLILLDRIVPTEPGLKPTDIRGQAIGESGEPFVDWVERMFPSVALRILTIHPYDSKSTVEARYIQKNSLDNPAWMAGELLGILMENKPEFWLALQEYANRTVTSWHTPGHNKGESFRLSTMLRPFHQAYIQSDKPLVFTSDLSVSVSQLGDLSEPLNTSSPMSQAMERAARVFGAARTYFCTNGTSSSNKTLLMTLLKPGEVVLIDRNCHKSVHQAIVMAGAIPFYLTPRFNSRLGVWKPLSLSEIADSLDQAFAQGLEPRLLVLTTCTYDGVLFPVYELAHMLHERGVLLQADEAWFPYGRFHPYYANGAGTSAGRYNALDSNADFCVHSAHKALAAFSQASMLHVGNHFKQLLEEPRTEFAWLAERFKTLEEFEHRLIENLGYWLSTSPHYPMIASLDAATSQMSIEGGSLIGNLLRLARKLNKWAEDAGCEVGRNILLDQSDSGYEKYGLDPLKFTVRVKPKRKRDFCERLIRERHQWEKSSARSILFLLTTGTFQEHVDGLLSVLDKNKSYLGDDPAAKPLPLPDISGQVTVLPSDAHYATGEYLPLDAIKNLAQVADESNKLHPIACHMVTPYPPGVPTILPGLRVTSSTIEWIQQINRDGGEVHGLFEYEGSKTMRVLLDTPEYRKLVTKYAGDGTGEVLSKLSPLKKAEG
jgi:arginine decarboxylase